MSFFCNKHTVDEKLVFSTEEGTKKYSLKAQRNKAQRLFIPLKEQNKRRTLNFIFSEVQSNFCSKLFDSVEV